MNDLERYVDILFADYRQYIHAEKLRIDMLNELLLKKEQLQMAGKSESEAVHEVLTSLDDFGAPAEGNYLIFSELFRHDDALNRLLWLIVGLVLTVPCVVVGQYILPVIMLVTVLFFFVRDRKLLKSADAEKVSFFDFDVLRHFARRYWKTWLVFSLIYLVIVYLWNTDRLVFLPSLLVEGPLGSARKLLRFYPPLVMLVLPLWATERGRIMLRHEMGADRDEAVLELEACLDSDNEEAAIKNSIVQDSIPLSSISDSAQPTQPTLPTPSEKRKGLFKHRTRDPKPEPIDVIDRGLEQPECDNSVVPSSTDLLEEAEIEVDAVTSRDEHSDGNYDDMERTMEFSPMDTNND